MDGTIKPEQAQRDAAPAAIPFLDRQAVERLLPHRAPMLMVDHVEDVVFFEHAIGVKHVGQNDFYFEGHFPGHPVMPGVFVIECMAQTAALLVVGGMSEDNWGKVVYFISIENAKFRRPVMPGCELRVHMQTVQRRSKVWRVHGVARVDGVDVAEATLAAWLRDKPGEM